MSDDGVAAVHDGGVVAALVEHAHLGSDHGCEVHRAAHGALVGADEHQILAIHLNVGNVAQKRFDELVGRLHILKGFDRNGILNAGVVRIEGDDGFDAEVREFLQSYGAVQRLTGGALVLAALVEERHDDRDAAGLTA